MYQICVDSLQYHADTLKANITYISEMTRFSTIIAETIAVDHQFLWLFNLTINNLKEI